jgi:hypothetical protein
VTTERTAFSVASFKPFWRWAVCLEHRPELPAIPYYRRAEADVFADTYRADFPGRSPLILKRVGWRSVSVAP